MIFLLSNNNIIFFIKKVHQKETCIQDVSKETIKKLDSLEKQIQLLQAQVKRSEEERYISSMVENSKERCKKKSKKSKVNKGKSRTGFSIYRQCKQQLTIKKRFREE